MKPYDENEDDVAAIGIGAMIVFIALILVAAVASTIIIKTAEELQQRAEKTGDDTREEISGKVQIINAYVQAATAGSHVLSILILGQLSSGSDTVLAGDIHYFVVCDGGAALASDTALVSASTGTTISGGALTATTAVPGGTAFTFIVTLTNCGGAGSSAPGDTVELQLIIDGGGETYAQLEIGDLAEGSTLV